MTSTTKRAGLRSSVGNSTVGWQSQLLITAIALLGLAASFLLVSRASAGTSGTSLPATFDLDSTRSTYPFVMHLQGTIEPQDDSLVIRVRSGRIRSAIPMHLGEQGVARDVRIVFGLGEKTAQGWTTSRDTPAQVVATSLAPGETRPLGPLRFVIDAVKGIPLDDRWLAASLGVMQRLPGTQAGLLWSYACAEENLLGATEASRRRATLMRGAYAQGC